MASTRYTNEHGLQPCRPHGSVFSGSPPLFFSHPSSSPAGLVLGVALLITFAISISAIIQPNHVTIGLIVLNWALILDALGILIIGSFIWLYTLHERNNFQRVFLNLSVDQRISIQDQVCFRSLPHSARS